MLKRFWLHLGKSLFGPLTLPKAMSAVISEVRFLNNIAYIGYERFISSKCHTIKLLYLYC